MFRGDLGQPLGTDAPWLAAILQRLDDIHTLLEKLAGTGPEVRSDVTELRKVQEPAPDRPPAIEQQPPQPEADDDPPPPRAGRGGSTDAWAAWAQRHDLAVTPGASRAQIIAACEAAGLIAKEG